MNGDIVGTGSPVPEVGIDRQNAHTCSICNSTTRTYIKIPYIHKCKQYVTEQMLTIYLCKTCRRELARQLQRPGDME